jgi:hypothetical protein
MLKVLVACFVFLALISESIPAAQAVGYCPSNPGGKCPNKRNSDGKSRDQFTPEQRKKILEEARQLCIRSYGASSGVYRYEWKKRRVICNTPGM